MNGQQQKIINDINDQIAACKASFERKCKKLIAALYHESDEQTVATLSSIGAIMIFAAHTDFLNGYEKLIAKFKTQVASRASKDTCISELSKDIVVQVRKCARLHIELDMINNAMIDKTKKDDYDAKIAELTAENKRLRELYVAECLTNNELKNKLSN